MLSFFSQERPELYAIIVAWKENWVISTSSFLRFLCWLWVRTHSCATRNNQSCRIYFGLTWTCDVCRHCHHRLYHHVERAYCIPKKILHARGNGNEFMVILSFPMANAIFCLFIRVACLLFVFAVNRISLCVYHAPIYQILLASKLLLFCVLLWVFVFHVHRK